MKHFHEVLRIIGGQNILILQETDNWDYWAVDFDTPVGPVKGYYLYLKSKCPYKEASAVNIKAWKKHSNNNPYDIIIPPKSQFLTPSSSDSMADAQQKTKDLFGGRRLLTSKQLLQDILFKNANPKLTLDEPFFIDPDIESVNGEMIKEASKFLTNWCIPPNNGGQGGNNPIALLRANAGVGKTTLARILTNKIYNLENNTIPLLIESEDWKTLIQTDISLSSIWDMAILKALPKHRAVLSDEETFSILIREGIFVIIFDGFDELCLNPNWSFKPTNVIQSIRDLLGNEDTPGHARILLTTRETYWQGIKDDVDTRNMDLFILRGFSNEQRQQYFSKRLDTPEERDIALRIASQVSGKLYDGLPVEGENTSRFTGVPVVLDMIANLVKDNPNKTELNPYTTDPLAPLIDAICRRENVRQTLSITPEKQVTFFEEIFREFGDKITLDNIKDYLSFICDIKDEGIIQRFSNHFFLKRTQIDSFAPKHEVLKVYFIARFLGNSLVEATKIRSDRKKISQILANSSSGKTHLVDWLVSQLRQVEEKKLILAIKHAFEILIDKENEPYKKLAQKTLFDIIVQLITVSDKTERTNELSKYIKTVNKSFSGITFSGTIASFDFRGYTFDNCAISDAIFKNCLFDRFTIFNNCSFDGELLLTTCKGEELIQANNCSCTKEIEIMFDGLCNRTSRPEVLKSFAEEALFKALKKFKKQFGYASISDENKQKGMPHNNPFNSKIWKVLEHNGITQTHFIVGTSSQGVHVTENVEVRREIANFIDNGYPGKTLKMVISDLLQ